MSVPDIDPNYPKKKWQAHWKEVKKRGTLTITAQHRAKDGRLFPVEMSLNYLAFGGKEYEVAFAKDITGQKQAEEDLTESQELFRSTLNSMDDAVIILGKTGFILGYHKPPGWENFLNIIPFIGRNYEKVLPNDLVMRLRPAVERASNTGCVQHFEHNLQIGNMMGWFSVKVSSRRDISGKISGFTIVSRNITERKRSVEKLARSENKYKRLVENLDEGVWSIDKDAYTTFVNSRTAQMLGYSQNEMAGEHMFSFMDTKGAELFKKHLQKRKRGIRESYEFELIRKDGSRLQAHINASPLFDDEGSYIGAIAALTELGKRKK